jgi:hypothetical protein
VVLEATFSISGRSGFRARRKGRGLIRGILNSSHNIEPHDRSLEAVNLRRLERLKDLDGVVFNAKVKAVKGDYGRWKNEFDTAVMKESNVVSSDTKNEDKRTEKADFNDESKAAHAASDTQPMWMR